jgi:hypothetical protein
MWKTAWFPLQIVDFSDLWYLPQGNIINNNGISWQNPKKKSVKNADLSNHKRGDHERRMDRPSKYLQKLAKVGG